MDILNIPLEKIKPYGRNPRKNDQAVDAVAASIKEFGFLVPIVVDRNNEIVCGHTRYKAAKKLKMAELPCVIAEELSSTQIKAFRLADNKTAEIAEWDFPSLAEELNGLFDFDMAQFGFDNLEQITDKAKYAETEKSSILTDKYVFPPMSVLDGRSSKWMGRKKTLALYHRK